ncbi:DUF6309 family protein [Nocardiopsis dassonvillei]|uniref:Uncharacterized protein n=1 Tax=Nocardiopsis dassonvillei (strain ATCC 23218 / DSM 43111 / CIP 107115 / JCM 7437 / KCTC 9190 / NBRC 14626 / NCTC 10488 / NRRL B-5397 / IMRU 509) TaxID=446468 RepID=D7B3G8_NOCDD|nr:DUF6309 family protein [Nocardiopsis dassonvillei]ADH66896.1 conserved hypothetical protein [Nocardiopsis dassonvillei subsp. dassonvillei DSM 43111]NKY81506.1 hypothetical protein [Nocardiopsis dassonvillei]VEI86634.1 Uncharacterised protein [Nocardiopsis dassonvillei]
MQILEPVTPDTVIRRFRATHPLEDEVSRATNTYAESALTLATRQLGGRWHRVALDREDVLSVLLPWHTGEYGERELVPPAGATVAETLGTLTDWGREYPASNPVCWGKLDWHTGAARAPLFLSSRALDHPFYERLERTDAVTHLDGLHRMLAWALADRLPSRPLLEAYLAGPLPDLRDPDAPSAARPSATAPAEATADTKEA